METPSDQRPRLSVRMDAALDQKTRAKLEGLASHFGEPHAEVIRQLIAQAKLGGNSPSWHLAVEEGRQRQVRRAR